MFLKADEDQTSFLGWGALSMLRKLRADHFNVTIVSPRNYFLFTPLLPSTTTGTINIQAIIEPIRDYCRRANAGHAVYVGCFLFIVFFFSLLSLCV